MSAPLDYATRQALHKQAHTTTPERPSPTWQRLLTEAQVKFHTGLAGSMPEALGLVAKEQPALYEAYRQEQLAACGTPVAKSVPVEVTQDDTSVVQFTKLVDAAMAAAPGLTRTAALGKVLASPAGQKLRKAFYADHPQHKVRS